MTARLHVLQLCFLSGVRVNGIEEFLDVFLPPTNYILSEGQQLPIPTICTVDKLLLSQPETTDSLPEFLQG